MKAKNIISSTEKAAKKTIAFGKALHYSVTSGLKNYKDQSNQIDLEITLRSVEKEEDRLTKQHIDFKMLEGDFEEVGIKWRAEKKEQYSYYKDVCLIEGKIKDLQEKINDIPIEDPRLSVALSKRDNLEYELEGKSKKLNKKKEEFDKLDKQFHELGRKYRELRKRHIRECIEIRENYPQVFADGREQPYLIEEEESKNKLRTVSFMSVNPATKARLSQVTEEDINSNLIAEMLNIITTYGEVIKPGLKIIGNGSRVNCYYQDLLVITYNQDNCDLGILKLLDCEEANGSGKEGKTSTIIARGKGENLSSLGWKTEDAEKEMFLKLIEDLYTELICEKPHFKVTEKKEVVTH